MQNSEISVLIDKKTCLLEDEVLRHTTLVDVYDEQHNSVIVCHSRGPTSRIWHMQISLSETNTNTTRYKYANSKQVWMFYRPGRQLALARCFMFTHQGPAVFCMKWRHGRHLETVTSNQISDSVFWWVFMWRTFLPNFILIRFETTEHQAFSRNDVMAASLKLWHHIGNPTPSISVDLI